MDKLRFTQSKSILRTLAKNSFKAIDEGLYDESIKNNERNYYAHKTISLKNQILSAKNIPLITEIKYASPSKGVIVDSEKFKVEKIASMMQYAGASGISVLSQPYLFHGSVSNVRRARRSTTLPILMKDIIVSDVQIKAAKASGADCILFIKSIFDKDLAEKDLETLLEYACKIGLEIILETHDMEEFDYAVKLHQGKPNQVHIIGINNRNLDTLEVSLNTTIDILSNTSKSGNLIISESGINQYSDIRRLVEAGADAFLIGSSLMTDPGSMEERIKELSKME